MTIQEIQNVLDEMANGVKQTQQAQTRYLVGHLVTAYLTSAGLFFTCQTLGGIIARKGLAGLLHANAR